MPDPEGCGIDAERVSQRLWIGALPPDGDAVVRAGFDVLVLCAAQLQDGNYEGKLLVLRCPLLDRDPEGQNPGADPTPEELERAGRTAKRLAFSHACGRRVLVTCRAGRNRSGLVTALTLREITGFSGRVCVELVRAGRTRQSALTNCGFVRALERLR